MSEKKNIYSDSLSFVFDICLKNLIIQYSDDSKELSGLMICSKSINKIFGPNFSLRRMYYIDQMTDFIKLKIVKNVTFGDKFNDSLDQKSLPGSLTLLKFGDCFNQPIIQGS